MTLLDAAKAVVARWDTPLWKDVPATADYIAALRQAIEQAEKQEPREYCKRGLKTMCLCHLKPPTAPAQQITCDCGRTHKMTAYGWASNEAPAQPSPLDVALVDKLVEQAQQPLTTEQIYEMYSEPCSDAEMVAFARAIEAAHGIKGASI